MENLSKQRTRQFVRLPKFNAWQNRNGLVSFSLLWVSSEANLWVTYLWTFWVSRTILLISPSSLIEFAVETLEGWFWSLIFDLSVIIRSKSSLQCLYCKLYELFALLCTSVLTACFILSQFPKCFTTSVHFKIDSMSWAKSIRLSVHGCHKLLALSLRFNTCQLELCYIFFLFSLTVCLVFVWFFCWSAIHRTRVVSKTKWTVRTN